MVMASTAAPGRRDSGRKAGNGPVPVLPPRLAESASPKVLLLMIVGVQGVAPQVSEVLP